MVSPPTAAATTGVPVACASTATSPNDSLYDGTATAVAAAYQRASSAWDTGGTNRTTSASPSSAARSASACGLSSPVPDGPPTTGTTSRSRRPGSRASSSATARSSTSGALSGWIRPANSSTSESVGQAERGARLGRRHRPEDVEVDAGVDDLDPAGVGVVQVDQLLGLEVGVRDQQVGGLDDLLLADDPGERLGDVAVGERVVLDLRHRVHRVHQRHAPAVAGQRADLAGEPVVRVHDVVVADGLPGLGAQHLAREHAQLRGQLLLGQPLERAGVDVPDRDPVVQAHLGLAASSSWRG